MGQSAKIRPAQIARAKKLLQSLPEKDDAKTRQEAAKILEKDFQKAKKKGYTPKELRQILKNEGIIVPAYLIKQFFTENENISIPAKKEKRSMKMNEKEKNSFSIPDASDEEL